jgi:hypothetical protein
MFERASTEGRCQFVDRGGHRVLLVDDRGLSPEQHIRALDPVRNFITSQPPDSLLLMTLANGRFTAASAEAIKRYAHSVDPHVRASAVVCTPGFRSAFVALLNTQVRHEIRCFGQESDAVAWLVTQAAEPGNATAP